MLLLCDVKSVPFFLFPNTFLGDTNALVQYLKFQVFSYTNNSIEIQITDNIYP